MSQQAAEPSGENLYAAVGGGLSTWVLVENALLSIYQASIGASFTAPNGYGVMVDVGISTIMETIDNFRSRVMLIDAALLRIVTGLDDAAREIADCWTKEKRKLSGLAANRNKLAHWYVLNTVNGVRLTPPQSKARGKYQDHEGFSAADVWQWAKSFEQASNRLDHIGRSLGSHHGIRRKQLEPAAMLLRQTARYHPDVYRRLIVELGIPQLADVDTFDPSTLRV